MTRYHSQHPGCAWCWVLPLVIVCLVLLAAASDKPKTNLSRDAAMHDSRQFRDHPAQELREFSGKFQNK